MNFRCAARLVFIIGFALVGVVMTSCAQVDVPSARNVEIPNPVKAEKRREAVNERPDSVMYLPLGEDVLVPERIVGQNLPSEIVGPFELRSETLAGALQLILADYDISIAFESDRGMTKKVTVANLKGQLDKVVGRVCSLADLYCSYEDGAIVVKDTQTFTVTLPPLGTEDGGEEYIDNIITGLTAVLGGNGSAPVSDSTTRTVIYSATHRTSKLAENYFQRLRANTAMIVFETYIWEVSLDTGNSTGIEWDRIGELGKFNASIGLNGGVNSDFSNPVTIGLPTLDNIGATPTKLLQFLSTFGAVKAISQPQITVLSGSSAELRVADTENYVSEVTQTISGDNTATSVSTDSVDSGFTLGIASSWDKSTIYANIDINLSNVDEIDNFVFDTDAGGGETRIQLPQTTERELKTQIRVRPGDSVLIAGLVRERDNFSSRGPGFMKPIIPDSRTARTDNLELVIMLRPRVVVYSPQNPSARLGGSLGGANNIIQQSVLNRRVPVAPVPTVPVQSYAQTRGYEESLEPVIQNTISQDQSAPAAMAPPVQKQSLDLNKPALVPRSVSPVVAPDSVSSSPIQPSVSLNVPVVAAPIVQRAVQPSVPVAPVYMDSGYRSTGGLTRGKFAAVPTQPAYEKGYVSERSNSVVTTRPSSSVYSPASVSQPSQVYDADTSGPMSPNIYNNATRLNVYDVYNGE